MRLIHFKTVLMIHYIALTCIHHLIDNMPICMYYNILCMYDFDKMNN